MHDEHAIAAHDDCNVRKLNDGVRLEEKPVEPAADSAEDEPHAGDGAEKPGERPRQEGSRDAQRRPRVRIAQTEHDASHHERAQEGAQVEAG